MEYPLHVLREPAHHTRHTCHGDSSRAVCVASSVAAVPHVPPLTPTGPRCYLETWPPPYARPLPPRPLYYDAQLNDARPSGSPQLNFHVLLAFLLEVAAEDARESGETVAAGTDHEAAKKAAAAAGSDASGAEGGGARRYGVGRPFAPLGLLTVGNVAGPQPMLRGAGGTSAADALADLTLYGAPPDRESAVYFSFRFPCAGVTGAAFEFIRI